MKHQFKDINAIRQWLSRCLILNPVTALITATCIITACMEPITYYAGAPAHHYFLYHFFHANIFHLAANLYALWLYRPRLSTIGIAYAVATICAGIDAFLSSAPTCGLSAFLFAAFARYYVAWHKSVLTIIIAILVTAIIPNMNWHIHILSFAVAYIVWFLIYRFKK